MAMVDFNRMWSSLQGAANQTAQSMPWLGVPGIMAKPLAEAGLAGLGWGAGATKAAASGHMIDPAPSLWHTLNMYGLGGPASGLTSGGTKAAPWFSAVGRAIESAPLKTAPNQQWMGWLKNQQGIKQEELDWMGVPEWLASQPGPITKQQLSDYIGQNKVDVQEVVKGEKAYPKDAEGWPVPGHSMEHETKFSQYQLPGGENYRELLLTLPPRELSQYHITPKGGISTLEPGVFPNRDAAFEHYQSMPREQQLASEIKPVRAGPEFESSHFDEPNVLAHVRFNDRVDAQGKKTLFLEEIQSDWHQKGRKQGYSKNPLTEADEIAGALGVPQTKSGVPDAPFKTSWPELALKRMVKWAADNGYDQIAWTPGKVQADRYDLSKHIKEIEYIKRGDKYELGIDMHRGEPMNKTLSADELDDFVGKEVADKIRNGEGQRYRGHEGLSLTGLDLQVGGEGMKGFYDKMLVSAANKLGKKFGTKVQASHIKADNAPEDVVNYWAAKDPEHPFVKKNRMEVWSLPITPEMREKVSKEGLPLFTGGKGGSLAAILGQALTGNAGTLGEMLADALNKKK